MTARLRSCDRHDFSGSWSAIAAHGFRQTPTDHQIDSTERSASCAWMLLHEMPWDEVAFADYRQPTGSRCVSSKARLSEALKSCQSYAPRAGSHCVPNPGLPT